MYINICLCPDRKLPDGRNGVFSFLFIPLGLNQSQAQKKAFIRNLCIDCYIHIRTSQASIWATAFRVLRSSSHIRAGTGGLSQEVPLPIWAGFPVTGASLGSRMCHVCPSFMPLFNDKLCSKSGIPSASIWNLFSGVHPPKHTQILTQRFLVAGWGCAFLWSHKEMSVETRVSEWKVVSISLSSNDQVDCERQVEVLYNLFGEETTLHFNY